jgi:hypothetical protein
MFTIELTEPQLRILKSFLERSEMRGYEVTQFLGLVQAISNAKPAKDSELAPNITDVC